MASGGAIQQIAFSFGTLIPPFLMIFAPTLTPGLKTQYWKIVYYVPIIINLGLLCGFLFIFDFRTPKYLMLKQANETEVKIVLKKLYGSDELVNKQYLELSNELEEQVKK